MLMAFMMAELKEESKYSKLFVLGILTAFIS